MCNLANSSVQYVDGKKKGGGGKVAIENPTAIDVYVYILQNGAI